MPYQLLTHIEFQKPVPVSKNVFEKLEKLNQEYYFNVNDWDDKAGMQPLIISKNFTRKHEVNLLVLNEESIGGKEKTHYLWVKNPSKLIFSNTKDNRKKKLCTICGQYFSSEIVLRRHQKYCYAHLDAPQFTELPEKDNNKLHFKKWKHMMRALA
nr:219_t:CDS:2 [Entrophospora candida]